MGHRIAIIGCGNIGSRLLQSVVKMSGLRPAEKLDIECVDPSADACDLAKARAAEAGADAETVNLLTSTDLDSLNGPYDLAILATTSRHRRSAFERLMARAAPRMVLFEKFLFPDQAAYPAVQGILRDRAVPAWVNCPRPEWPGWRCLKAELPSSRRIEFRVTGSNWALASNAIHFITLFSFLSGESVVRYDATGLDREVRTNKREGYLEVTGSLRGEGEKGSTFELVSLPDGELDIVVDVLSRSGRYRVLEGERAMTRQSEQSAWMRSDSGFETLYASEMEEVFDRLLNAQAVNLPTYEASIGPHLALIQIFNKVFFGEGAQSELCPVT